MNEIWRDIECYEGLYQVSNCGRVKSLGNGKTNSKEIIMKLGELKNGYLKVDLSKDGKVKTYYVHRLVAQAFISNPDNLQQVNHKDENKENNCGSNLEWCDAKYNSNYGTRNEKIAKAHINNEKKSNKVICVETGIVYPSSMEAQRQTGIYQSNIISCCKGKYKSAGGYHWKYTD